MNIYLSNKDVEVRLPVLPASFEINKGRIISVEQVEGLGEVSILGKRTLHSLSLESFFPANQAPFCTHSDIEKPYDYVSKITKMMAGSISLKITTTNIKGDYLIESFRYGEKDGTGNVYYNIDLKESRKPGVSTIPPKDDAKTHKVKAGDTWAKLAKKYYGTTSKAAYIAKLNGLKVTSKLKPGAVIKVG